MKNIILYIFTLSLFCFLCFYPKNVEAAGTCPGLSKMINKIGISSSHAIVDDKKRMTIKIKDGNFRLISYKLKGLNDYNENGDVIDTSADIILSTNLDDYIENKTEINSNNPLVIDATVGQKGAIIELEFGLVKEYNSCDVYDKTGDIIPYSIIVRNDGNNSYIENPHYNRQCSMLREGVNYNGEFNDIVGRWKSEYLNNYSNFFSYCFNNYVQFKLNDDTVKENIKRAIINMDSFTSNTYTSDPTFESRWNSAITKNPKGNVSKENRLLCSYIGNGIGDYLGTNLSYNKTDDSGKIIIDSNTKKPIYNIDANTFTFKNQSTSEEKVTYHYNNYTIVKDRAALTKEAKVCDITCREVIEVKYGPPVASKAGMCFEYRVQATSWVNCNSKIYYENGPKYGTLCNPVPYCNQYAGYTHQGGPNDSFDECIKKCDGGKYSKSCSNKCYNEVYNSKKSKKYIKTFSSFNNLDAKKLKSTSDLMFQTNNGRYIYSNGNIYWRANKNGASAVGYSRYYLQNEFWRTYYDHGTYAGKYKFDRDGFKVNILDNAGNTCSDPCTYYVDHCYGSNLYLNSDQIEADYKQNLSDFNAKVVSCKSKASCSKQTVDIDLKIVNDGKNDYYDSSSLNDGKCVAPEKNDFIKYGDCYNGCKGGSKYYANWGTSGTWFNIKNGNLSYSEKNLTDGWYKEEGKYCTPRNASNVNVKWWNYYYNKFVVNKKYSDGGEKSLLNKALEEAASCSKDGDGSLDKPVDLSTLDIDNKNDINWNIISTIRNFGYLGWNFDINCFYALFQCSNDYRIRSFDPLDMFPSTDGRKSNDRSNPNREPGFNWTQQAASNKKDSYLINPGEIIAETQQISEKRTSNSEGGIYDDYYLDYEVVLSSNAINRLRDKEHNYTSFENAGFSVDKNSNVRYESPLLKSDNAYGIQVKRPSGDLFKCNNIDGNKCK